MMPEGKDLLKIADIVLRVVQISLAVWAILTRRKWKGQASQPNESHADQSKDKK